MVNIVYGMLRILIAIIASVFMYFLVKARVVLAITEIDASIFAILTLSFASGFSETLVPNLLRKIETNSFQAPASDKAKTTPANRP